MTQPPRAPYLDQLTDAALDGEPLPPPSDDAERALSRQFQEAQALLSSFPPLTMPAGWQASVWQRVEADPNPDADGLADLPPLAAAVSVLDAGARDSAGADTSNAAPAAPLHPKGGEVVSFEEARQRRRAGPRWQGALIATSALAAAVLLVILVSPREVDPHLPEVLSDKSISLNQRRPAATSPDAPFPERVAAAPRSAPPRAPNTPSASPKADAPSADPAAPAAPATADGAPRDESVRAQQQRMDQGAGGVGSLQEVAQGVTAAPPSPPPAPLAPLPAATATAEVAEEAERVSASKTARAGAGGGIDDLFSAGIGQGAALDADNLNSADEADEAGANAEAPGSLLNRRYRVADRQGLQGDSASDDAVAFDTASAARFELEAKKKSDLLTLDSDKAATKPLEKGSQGKAANKDAQFGGAAPPADAKPTDLKPADVKLGAPVPMLAKGDASAHAPKEPPDPKADPQAPKAEPKADFKADAAKASGGAMPPSTSTSASAVAAKAGAPVQGNTPQGLTAASADQAMEGGPTARAVDVLLLTAEGAPTLPDADLEGLSNELTRAVGAPVRVGASTTRAAKDGWWSADASERLVVVLPGAAAEVGANTADARVVYLSDADDGEGYGDGGERELATGPHKEGKAGEAQALGGGLTAANRPSDAGGGVAPSALGAGGGAGAALVGRSGVGASRLVDLLRALLSR